MSGTPPDSWPKDQKAFSKEDSNQVTSHPNAISSNPSPNKEEKKPINEPLIPHLVSKLLEKAYKNAPTSVSKIYKNNQEERDIFMKYNSLTSPQVSTGLGYSPFQFRYVKYLPQNSGPNHHEQQKVTFPVVRKDLGFFPKLDFLQRFTQNVYSTPGEVLIEEKDTNLRSTRKISLEELKINTPESLEDYLLFKTEVESESFRR